MYSVLNWQPANRCPSKLLIFILFLWYLEGWGQIAPQYCSYPFMFVVAILKPLWSWVQWAEPQQTSKMINSCENHLFYLTHALRSTGGIRSGLRSLHKDVVSIYQPEKQLAAILLKKNFPLDACSPRMELPLQELQESLIADTGSHACYLKCLMSAIMKKIEFQQYPVLMRVPLLKRLLAPQWKSDLWKNKAKMAMGCVDLTVPQLLLNAIHTPPPFIMLAKTKTQSTRDDHILSCESTTISVCRELLLVMKKMVSCVGLLLPALLIPELVSHIQEGFYSPSNPAQAQFVSTCLHDIFRVFLLLLDDLAVGTVACVMCGWV